jgi:photosystem II stability/assembly factor-like uncharacterized protein
MRLNPRPAALGLTLVAAVALGSCGGGDDPPAERDSSEGSAQTSDPGMHHIHGLGVDPRSGALYIATHTGLFTAPEGERRARRFGDSRQDIMGFSIVGAGRFIGSGHPAPDQDLPPNLGLIRSTDGGRNWDSVSLSGEADFHALEASGSRIYGFDGTQGRLMVSRDGGRSWARRAPPAAMFGMAIDPRDSGRLLAGTDRGLFASADEGRGWRPLSTEMTGLLAWPAPDRLYLVEGDGRVRQSADGGRSWRRVGSIGGELAALTAQGRDIYAALADGTVKQSSDGGRSWTLRATP